MENKLIKTKINNNTKIISDNHFGHQKCFEEYEPIRKKYLKQNNKETFEEFEELMISNWNNSIKENDTILHLGDFIINKKNINKSIENLQKATKKLNGYKILIKGNHDRLDDKIFLEAGWNIVINKPLILLDNEIKIIENSYENNTGCIITKLENKIIMFSHFGIKRYDERYNNRYEKEFKYLMNLYNEYNCEINIHGHSHSSCENTKNSFNCSIENMNFLPKTIKEILK